MDFAVDAHLAVEKNTYIYHGASVVPPPDKVHRHNVKQELPQSFRKEFCYRRTCCFSLSCSSVFSRFVRPFYAPSPEARLPCLRGTLPSSTTNRKLMQQPLVRLTASSECFFFLKLMQVFPQAIGLGRSQLCNKSTWRLPGCVFRRARNHSIRRHAALSESQPLSLYLVVRLEPSPRTLSTYLSAIASKGNIHNAFSHLAACPKSQS